MPKDRSPRREAKKPKKKDDKKAVLPSTEFVSAEVETIAKRRKPKEVE